MRALLIALVLCALCAEPAGAQTLAYDPLGGDILATADGRFFDDPGTEAVLGRLDAHGVLDPSFGIDGRAWTAGRGLVRQPDGALVTYTFEGIPGRLRRYHPDGTPDESFGEHGELAIDILGSGAVAPLANGDLLLADHPNEGIRLRRLDGDGRGEPSFTSLVPASEYPIAVHPTPEGIVVGGGDFLMRFTGDGRLDERYGDHGIVAPIAGGPSAVSGTGIVVLGSVPGDADVLRRYRADGTRDLDWGDGGERRLGFEPRNPSAPVPGVALAGAPGGAVLAATTIADGGVAVTRVTADGELDPNWGGGGSTVLHIDELGGVSDLLALPDGGAALSYLTTSPSGDHSLALARLTATGAPDPVFGSGGVALPALAVEGPPVTIDSAQRSGTTATFTFSSPDADATFRCRLGASPFSEEPFEPCTSGIHYDDLAFGFLEFEVEALDVHGNFGPVATSDWTVPGGPPETSLAAAPPAHDRHTLARFSIVADQPLGSLVCTLDGAPVFKCSQSQSVRVREGEHVFTAQAVDTGGETDPTPAEHRWTVDTTAPETVLDSAPAAVTTDPDATFAFSSPEATTGYECRLDGAAWSPCTSPARFAALPVGRHTFGLRAVDLAGNADAGPVDYVWRIDPPVVPPPVVVTEPPAPTALAIAVAPRAVHRAGGGRGVLERVQVRNPLARRGTVRLCARYPRGWRPRHRLCLSRTLAAGETTTFRLRGRPPRRARSGKLRLTVTFPGLAPLRAGALWVARR